MLTPVTPEAVATALLVASPRLRPQNLDPPTSAKDACFMAPGISKQSKPLTFLPFMPRPQQESLWKCGA